MIGVLDISIPVAPRFVIFSLGSLLIGLIYLSGTIGGWNTFPSKKKKLLSQSLKQTRGYAFSDRET